MRSNQTVDMTRGNAAGLLIRFAIPMLIGNLFQQAYNLGDSMIVQRYRLRLQRGGGPELWLRR